MGWLLKLLGSLDFNKHPIIRKEIAFLEYQRKIGINIPNNNLGGSAITTESGSYFGSRAELLRHQYVLYRVSESFNISFNDWIKQPLYKLDRDIAMIKRVAVELESNLPSL